MSLRQAVFGTPQAAFGPLETVSETLLVEPEDRQSLYRRPPFHPFSNQAAFGLLEASFVILQAVAVDLQCFCQALSGSSNV